MGAYFRPSSLADALNALSDDRWTVVAGGTDYYPARVSHVPDDALLDITGIDAIRAVSRTDGGVRIGAATTWTDILEADLPAAFDGLKAAAREVGGVQIQNRGTLGGNLCNASPAADGIPALLSLDASVELQSTSGTRLVPLTEFILGNRQTAKRDDELLTAILVPDNALTGASTFLKLGARRYLVISIVMVAGAIDISPGGTIRSVRLAIGACSAAAQRLSALEADLTGIPSSEAAGRVAAGHFETLSPIDDPRGDSAFRSDAAITLTRRCVSQLAEAA